MNAGTSVVILVTFSIVLILLLAAALMYARSLMHEVMALNMSVLLLQMSRKGLLLARVRGAHQMRLIDEADTEMRLAFKEAWATGDIEERERVLETAGVLEDEVYHLTGCRLGDEVVVA